MVPKLIDSAKNLAEDCKALVSWKMHRTSASYKTNHGVWETIRENLIEKLNASFSLDADESTNNANDHILAILMRSQV